MVIPQRERERVLDFIAMAGELLLPELLFQSMAFPVHWRDRSVGWGCMSFDGFACMHVSGRVDHTASALPRGENHLRY